MRRGALVLAALALLGGCSRGDTNAAANNAEAAAPEDGDLNMAISGDELSPIPEAEDDMIANNSAGGSVAPPNAANAANAAAPPAR